AGGGRKGPRRGKSSGLLALEPWPAAIVLEIAFGEIDADAIAEHVIERVALRDVDARLADHHAELDFPIDALCLARHHEVVGGPAKGAGGFQKECRLLRQRQADFLRMRS